MVDDVPPGVAFRVRIPYFGVPLAYTYDPLGFMKLMYAQRGPVADVSMLGRDWRFVLGPDACEHVLQNPDKAFANGWEYLVGPFFRRGLMLLDFGEHHQHRRIMQHAFTRPRIEGYAAALAPAVGRELDTWSTGSGVKAYPRLKELTLNLATQIFMGGDRFADPAELDRVNRAFVACVQAGGAMVRRDVPGTIWHRATAGRRVLDEFLHRHLPVARASDGEDLFSVLCHLQDDDGARFTDQEVVNHMIFLLMAAHDTSTITATTAIKYLGQHPEWQDRCRAESLALDEHPPLAKLEALPSLDLVIRECLRLDPPVPVVARRTVKDTSILGVPVPSGTHLAVGVQLSHSMREYWTAPESFDPERFSVSRREDKNHRYAWEPFGGGVHKCLGMAFADVEVKTIMHQLLRRFSWSVDPAYVPPMNHISLPFPKDGLPVELRPQTVGCGSGGAIQCNGSGGSPHVQVSPEHRV